MSDSRLTAAARQTQFLSVLTRDEAERRFHAALDLSPLGTETVLLSAARGRVLATDVVSGVDVPGFDRSNVDGFAVRADDTTGASEESPITLQLNSEVLSPGVPPRLPVAVGTATSIATGGMFPRGADAVVMVEETDLIGQSEQNIRDAASFRDVSPVIELRRAAVPGQFVTFAGTDVAKGETALWRGQLLTAREIGVLAAIGCDRVEVYRKPHVAILSTGDEIVPPGNPLPAGAIYDSNSAIVAASVEELGGEPVLLGNVPDDEGRLEQAVAAALGHDVVILSGGTSKGAADLSYRVVSRFDDPGIVAHGVALKPGKPICLAVTRGKPVVILPGFPTSAIFTFHEFVAPVIRALGGRPLTERKTIRAMLPLQVHSDRGRTEYNLVNLVPSAEGLAAYPIGKGSGSVTTFSHADGFFTIDQHTEIEPAGSEVDVTLLDGALEPADLVVIGSHCVGLDFLLSRLRQEGFRVKSLQVGSTGGLLAARRGECDVAGIHLLDPATNEYNRPFLDEGLTLVPGYRRMQCFVFRPGDARFAGKRLSEALFSALADPGCAMVNRNAGSGTRILIDRLLAGSSEHPLPEGEGRVRVLHSGPIPLSLASLPEGEGSRLPAGYCVCAKSHNAVAAAVVQGRADWGVAIRTVADSYGLAAIPIQDEHYDFVVPRSRLEREAVKRFRELLSDAGVKARLKSLGFRPVDVDNHG